MAVDATTANPVVSGTTNNAASSSNSKGSIANNFQTFLTLLTTQLQHQNPLDPLDTNQFTAQLVQFASVEQQWKQNEQLTSLINLQKSAQATQALAFVGNTVAVDGSKTELDGSATWNVKAPKDTNASIVITNSAGQTVFSGNSALSAGNASFLWDGKGNDGVQYPKGTYTLTATGKDSSGTSVAISTEVQGVVDSVDLTASPPLLTVGGQTYTTDQIRRVVRTSSSLS